MPSVVIPFHAKRAIHFAEKLDCKIFVLLFVCLFFYFTKDSKVGTTVTCTAE